uniref:SoxAX cytochrome complex subunit A n=1 Tax=Candidatus Kentrum sp. MB TaxID=2138164 RepID=A0A451B8I4_9GAMM|nr:MAG: sulfur-oxidizing protein SoxA [Candidatus Kentron sp. MB]VFK74575.1 MAG: sulfur-oxidizing protein SoxA [Candidatus Kentron sp. MB]
MGNKKRWCVAAGLGMLALAVTATAAPDLSDPVLQDYIVGDRYTGYVISTPETRKMQDDDFDNPGFMWVEQAWELWSRAEGKAGKSCASCHSENPESLKGVATRYPKVNNGKLMALEDQINVCRRTPMQASEWKWESDEMLGMSALIRLQSRGMPINVKIDGEAERFYKQGKKFYYQRRGALDLACNHCHEINHGKNVRSDLLSMGMPNGFPTYRLKWQKLGSLHRRFRGCNKNIRSEPYKAGSPVYTALELYVMSRARGLPIETPSVRK